MKLLWVCNMVPGEVQKKITGIPGNGLWVDHVLSDIRKRKLSIRILCRGGDAQGTLDDNCSYALFPTYLPQEYYINLEAFFRKELQAYHPDVIHIWGTEYSHTLAMVNAAEQVGLLDRVVISLQGVCTMIAGHYCEGIPGKILRGYTFRDFVRQDNLLGQQKVFARRGDMERKALEKISHVMGRTDWDRACMEQIAPHAQYYFCGETLRKPFYQDTWTYTSCQKHRIFASSCSYPVKGFHYLLEAFAQLLKKYPDAVLAVPGKDFRKLSSWKQRLRENSYERYLRHLVARYNLESRIEILGSLSAEQMKEQYLMANVFVLPSTVENSPNSLGEAMLLGVPCVASAVGGVSTMMVHKQEGYIYQSTAPYMLAYYMDQIFSLEEKAENLGQMAAAHARKNHDPEKNIEDLMCVYESVAR